MDRPVLLKFSLNKNDIKIKKKMIKSSLFFGSIMAVFLHQIHLKIKRETNNNSFDKFKDKKSENIYKACDRRKKNY